MRKTGHRGCAAVAAASFFIKKLCIPTGIPTGNGNGSLMWWKTLRSVAQNRPFTPWHKGS